MNGGIPRRRVLASAAGLTVATAAPAAAQQASDTDSDLDGWFGSDAEGGATSNFDGTVVDGRGTSTVTVEVGAEGNGGQYAFAPPAVRLDPGTTVEFRWVSPDHNLVFEEQPVGADLDDVTEINEDGYTFEQTVQYEGTYKYYCQPHLSLGMKGAIVVGDPPGGGAGATGTPESATGTAEGIDVPPGLAALGGGVVAALAAGAVLWRQVGDGDAESAPSRGGPEDGPTGTADAESDEDAQTEDGTGAARGTGPRRRASGAAEDGERSSAGTTAADVDRASSGGGPPATVPRAPELDVAYEALEHVERIGVGGNAEVYLARVATADASHDLAVKEPRVEGTLHAETVDRLLREAETWAGLDDHDHVVGVLDWGGTPVPWIAMEYMDGGHLGERAGVLDLPEALWVGAAVADAINHAHMHGVVHLDLKPENVLFRECEDSWDVPKVGDWGLAKRLLDHSGTVEGLSPQYAAPEQLDEDHGEGDHATDVYQLGAVLYELFTGRPPFTGPTIEVVGKIGGKQPEPPTSVDPSLPAELDAVLLRALAKAKDDRYEQVVYLRDDLRDVLSAVVD